jgi:small subunit ribosomal protein S16
MGRKKRPFYRIVVTDSRAPRDGRYIESIGYYNPVGENPEIDIKEERALYWIDQGAIPSDTVKSLFRKRGMLYKRFLEKHGFDEQGISEAMKKWEVMQIEKDRRQEVKAKEAKKAKKSATEQEEKPEGIPEGDVKAGEAEPVPEAKEEEKAVAKKPAGEQPEEPKEVKDTSGEEAEASTGDEKEAQETGDKAEIETKPDKEDPENKTPEKTVEPNKEDTVEASAVPQPEEPSDSGAGDSETQDEKQTGTPAE